MDWWGPRGRGLRPDLASGTAGRWSCFLPAGPRAGRETLARKDVGSRSGPADRRILVGRPHFVAGRWAVPPPTAKLKEVPGPVTRPSAEVVPSMQKPTHIGTRGLQEELLDRRILLLDGS